MIVQKLFYSCSRKPLCEAKRMRKELLKSNPLHVHNFRLYQRFTSSSSNQNSQSGATEGNVEEVYDLIVVGGGIVGVTTARAMLIEKPNLRVAILEKEKDVAMHQSSHNSGVIHAGIYYRPGSLRAKLCVEGARQTYAFCDEHKIPYKKCGKLIVATTKEEEQNLFILYNYALKNGLDEVQSIDSDKIPEIEPFCQGIKAIYSPNTGIIDWGIFTKYCASDFQKRGGNLRCNFKVTKVKEAEKGSNSVDVSEAPLEFYDETRGKKIRSRYAIMCGGLYSDKLASLIDGVPLPVIVPFRGEYLELKEEKRHLIKGNIYPVPNPNFPFLGVHFTPRLDGRVLVGPNAILAFSREGYRWDQINKEELMEVFKFQGFRKLLSDYAIYGVKEALKSWIIQLRVKDLRKYIPSIKSSDLEFRGFTGVRAQALDEDGSLVEDMVLQIGSKGIESRILHCRNAPSPSATSSLALSEFIAKSAIVEFDFDA